MPSRPLFLLSVALAGLLLAACGKSQEQQMRERDEADTKYRMSGTVDRTAREDYTIPIPPKYDAKGNLVSPATMPVKSPGS